MASVLWTNVRGTDAKPCAARVYRRSSNADALGDHPRHRTHYWYQCPGRVPQALVLMSGPGQACPNKFSLIISAKDYYNFIRKMVPNKDKPKIIDGLFIIL